MLTPTQTLHRLTPGIHGIVSQATRPTDDESGIERAINTVVRHYQANPVVQAKKHGRRDFVDVASELIAHRDSTIGFYASQRHDEDHNRRVAHADEVFPFQTRHTRKNGLINGLLREETTGLAAVFASAAANGLSVAGVEGGLTGVTSVLPVAWQYRDHVNTVYQRIGEHADHVWDAYVERHAYDEDVSKPSLPFQDYRLPHATPTPYTFASNP